MNFHYQILWLYSFYLVGMAVGQGNQTVHIFPVEKDKGQPGALGVVETQNCKEGAGNATTFWLGIEGCQGNPCTLNAQTNYTMSLNWTQGIATSMNNIRLLNASGEKDVFLGEQKKSGDFQTGQVIQEMLILAVGDVETTNETFKLYITRPLDSLELCRLFPVQFNGVGTLMALPWMVFALQEILSRMYNLLL